MSVIINSGVPGSASYGSSLTDLPLIYSDPSTPGVDGPGNIPISQVTGLAAALSGKLNDTTGPVGAGLVYANGVDLNLLAGLVTFGLTQSDLQKLSQVNSTATEMNYLIGVTGSIQTQINAAFASNDFTAAQQMIVSTGSGVGVIATINDVLGGIVGPGYKFSDLKLATASLNFNNQLGINVATPIAAHDAATKLYVDQAVAGSGGGVSLPLAGGVMAGTIDMDGNTIILDPAGTTRFASTTNNTAILNVNGSLFTWTSSGFNMGGRAITNVLNPSGAQDAMTKSYADTTYLSRAGGVMTGTIDMDGNGIILDPAGTTRISAATNNQITIAIGSTNVILNTTSIDVGGVDLHNLPASPGTSLSAITTTYADGHYLMINGSNSLQASLNFNSHNVLNLSTPTIGTEIGTRDYNDARYLQLTNNLSDLSNASIARTNLGLATVASTGQYSSLIGAPTPIVNLDDLADVITGSPGAPQNGYVITWNNGSSRYNLAPASVRSVFGRTGIIISVNGDYTASQITNTPAGNVIAVTVQAAITELDNNKLARSGTQSMLGTLNLNSFQITNMGLPFIATPHQFTTTEYQSTLGGGGFFIRAGATPNATTPTYTFATDPTTGMWYDSGSISFSVAGVRTISIGANIDVLNRQIKNITNPTANGDAVNLGYLNGLGVQRILGQVTGVNLFGVSVGTTTAIYTLPVGVRHIITKVILMASSYVPGISPQDAVISIGTTGPGYDQIINGITASWGPAGAADQAIYLDPDQGVATPNATNTISIQVDVPAGGTFTALSINVYVIGYQL